ncbi:hypothetical protein DFJ43DRAFT_1148945 [Lentinula guzmanii]|uniref:AB hydrolase-1 domain-containing protein n=1 Tax=Lentinula guzmanii TaxID=2804957 RepID=A0AA38JJ83_9AGAR|nr:hypothetical protein DFJ43DRAFT_1148945 [Lentinula guzmanii]
MPIFTLPNHVRFFYEDSGVPAKEDYTTFFIIHGHTYHSGLFKLLLPVGLERNHRILLVNRRDYPQSSPYSAGELKVFAEGPDEARYAQLLNDGSDLALLLDRLIQSLSLPQSGVAIVSWSLGNVFGLPLLASITMLPVDTQARLGLFVKRTILWDAPCEPMGIPFPPGTYHPFLDDSTPVEDRGVVFAQWLTSYFPHGDLSKHDFSSLNQQDHDKTKKHSFEDLSREELFKIIDLAPGSRCDTHLCSPPYLGIEKKIMNKALYDPSVRAAWKNMKVWEMVGDQNPWNVIYCWWTWQEEVKAANTQDPAINFTVNPGANHFFMWDDPEGSMNKLEYCWNN